MEMKKRLRPPIENAGLLLPNAIFRTDQIQQVRQTLQRFIRRMLHPGLLSAIPAKAAKPSAAHAGSHHHVTIVPATRPAPHIMKSAHTRTRLTNRIRLQPVLCIHAVTRLVMAANRSQGRGSQQGKRHFTRSAHGDLYAMLPEFHQENKRSIRLSGLNTHSAR
jgi:hypothetical protein